MSVSCSWRGWRTSYQRLLRQFCVTLFRGSQSLRMPDILLSSFLYFTEELSIFGVQGCNSLLRGRKLRSKSRQVLPQPGIGVKDHNLRSLSTYILTSISSFAIMISFSWHCFSAFARFAFSETISFMFRSFLVHVRNEDSLFGEGSLLVELALHIVRPW